MSSPLLEQIGADVIEKVLARGRGTGAEFSEIFIEDKRSTSAGFDDGKADAGPAADDLMLAGLKRAKELGMSAPGAPATGAADSAKAGE